MLIQIRQQIKVKNDIRAIKEPYKEFESDIILHKGDFFTDSAFKDPYEHEVTEVTVSYQENTCYVHITPVVFEFENANEKHVDEYVKMMALHGWKCIV